ncbi:MAG: serine/threonine-protein kinase, partial [Actinomycetota bacterium]
MLSDAIGEVPYIGDPVEVGRGGFATVYRATDLQAGRPVAVKLLSLRADDGNLKHFDRERESLARLSTHPNVVTLHRTGVTTGGVPYLVMELATGGSLADRLRADGPMAWNEAVDWILPICDAIEHAHEQGIRHRDIKPQNILISAHGEPLLSDFGIAGLSAGPETVTQQAKLSLSYASPEQIEGRELDDSSDIYSIGATLFALMTGAPAFADTGGAGFLNTAKRIVEERAPTLDEPVPADISAAVAAALAKNPATRPTIQELRRALAREEALEAPPATDALPAITQEVVRSAGNAVPGAILAPVVDEATVTTAQLVDDGDAANDDGLPAILANWSRRWLMTAALVLLVAAGLVTAAWTQRGDGDDAADRDEVVAGES